MDELKGTVIVYSRIGCAQSLNSKNLLASLGLPYLDISIDAFPKVEEQLREAIGGPVQTPQIFFNTLRVSGYKDLRRLASSPTAWSEILEMLERGEDEDNKSESDKSDDMLSSKKDSMSEEGSERSGQRSRSQQVDEHLIPDEYETLVKIFRRANLIRDGGRNQAHRNSFKGEDFINFIMREEKVKRSEALELGQVLIDKHFGPRMARETIGAGGMIFSTDHYYLMHDEDPNIPLNVVSMPSLSDSDLTIPVLEMNNRLCTVLQRLYSQILSENQKLVLYDRLEDNDNFRSYLALVADLPRINLKSASNHERMALFINVYNMMLIHIVYKYGVHSNVWVKRKYYNSTYYLISKYRYSLQSIRNGILRGNRKGVGMLWKPFGKMDPRREHIIYEGEPLIHFALNSYSLSTPRIRVYSVKNLIREMSENAREYLEREENLWYDTKKQTIYLSELFKLFSCDFGCLHDQAIEWIIELLEDGTTKESLARIYLGGQFSVNYLPFNFDPNIIRDANDS